MAADPIASGDPALLGDLSDDLFGPVGTGRDEGEFWNEAEKAHHGGWASTIRPRRHRPSRTAAAAAGGAGASTAKRTLRGRLGAAWAAEASARRALRYRPEGAPKEPGKGRKVAVALVGVMALVVVGVAVADLLSHSSSASEDPISDASAGLASGNGRSSTDGEQAAASDVDGTVPSKVVDPAPSSRSGSRADRPSASTAKPKASAGSTATTAPSKTASPSPSTATPAKPAPVTTVPTTAAPKPVTPTTAPPATTAPPVVKPSVQSFDAKPASSPGGACGTLQWATVLTWNTTSATAVKITGLLEPTLGSLPGDGSKTVCRALPGGPLGGWTLTATGPGGSTTASA